MCSKIICVAFVAVLVCSAVVALPSQDSNEKDLINMLNRVDSQVSLPLFGGLSVDRVETGRSFGASKSIESFQDRAARYLETHELNLAFPDIDSDDDDTDNDGFSGRGMEESRSKKMKKMLVPLLLLLKLKKAIIVKVLFTIIKFISLKSLIVSTIALIFAGATFFKDLMKKKDHITTAYITGSPLNAEIVHSDWNRNGQASAAELAYNHYGLAQPY